MGLGSMLADKVQNGLSVVAAIGNQMVGCREPFQHGFHSCLVRRLTRRQHDTYRAACFIDHGVDLGAQSTTRATEGVIRIPLFPAAVW